MVGFWDVLQQTPRAKTVRLKRDMTVLVMFAELEVMPVTSRVLTSGVMRIS
jgi:hypothetical protein